jgi:hypothetical protein
VRGIHAHRDDGPSAWIVNDEPLLNAGKPLASGRIDIGAEIELDEDDDKEARPTVGEV